MFLNVRCSRCSDKAIYHKAYSGEYFCASCFGKSVEEKTVKTISKYNMLKYGERILLMVSGGKDSLAMLRILNKIARPHGSELAVATIDEGIEDYREDAVEIAKNACLSLNVPHHVFEFKELFGYTMDQIEQLKDEQSSCSLCGILRRRAMDIIARRLNIHVVATAHNLDDILQTFLINLLNNDIKRLPWNLLAHNEIEFFNQRRIKPLAEIYEEELALYSFLNKEQFQSVSCPYMHEGIRSEIRTILNTLEKNHPGIKYSLLKSMIEVSENTETVKKEIEKCEKCGYPTFSKTCSVCSLLNQLNQTAKKIKDKGIKHSTYLF